MSEVDVRDVHVVAPNFKRRLSGVTSTIVQLVPLQARSIAIATLGPGLPDSLPRIGWLSAIGLLRRPRGRPFRIWHARRNTEMLAGVVLKHVLRAPMKLLFTSAAQRRHTAYTRWLIRRMDAVIATSRRSGAYLDVPHEVVMHGIDTERFSPPATEAERRFAAGPPEGKAIGCFGRVRHQKGTDLFVDAMIALLPDHPDWFAVVTGRVTTEHAAFARGLEEKVAAAGLSERILFLGEVPDIRAWYRRVSLYVAPSRNEGFGLTPLEAMASGAAVVASDAGAYAELVEDGVTGSVVPAGDGTELTAALRLWMSDPARVAEASRTARERVARKFPLVREAEEIRRVYERLWERAA
jgi:mannosyltransferase